MTKKIAVAAVLSIILAGCVEDQHLTLNHHSQYVIYQKVPVKRPAIRVQTLQGHTNIIVFSDHLFKPRSSVFSTEHQRIMHAILSVFQQPSRPKPKHIKISAFYSDSGSHQDLKVLTSRQAENVAAYLWSHGVPKNHISFHGYGKKKPVSNNATVSGSVDNRRIEIDIR